MSKLFVHIVAARPNFIKAAPVVEELKLAGQDNYIIHTNQHYDYEMSKVFFEELEIPEPDAHLGTGSGTHAEQTASSLLAIEKELLEVEPDYVVVYGDVNSSLAGALAAAKLNIPVIHIESGCRSFDDSMPEEVNRKMIDSISTILTCTEDSALRNLPEDSNAIVVGNTAIDSIYNLQHGEPLIEGDYYLATFHRPFNVDDSDKLHSILSRLNKFSHKVVIPAHPRLKKNIRNEYSNIEFTSPVGYASFINYIRNSKGVVSDSGGIQCEAAYYRIPLLTVRPSTEHLFTLNFTNRLVSVDGISEDNFISYDSFHLPFEWDGNAAKRAVKYILEYDSRNS